MFSMIVPKLRSLTKCTARIDNYQTRNFISAITFNNITIHNSCNYNLKMCRCKSRSKKLDEKAETDTEEEQNMEEEIIDKNTKILSVKVNSMRTDLLLKMGLGMARNKIETLFYESKIRVNGMKIFKKSTLVNPGDEIDIIKGVNINNPKFLVVARVEVLSVKENEDRLNIKLRRTKSIIIENYKDPWKGNTTN